MGINSTINYPSDLIVVFIKGGIAQWAVSELGCGRVIIIDHDKDAEEEYATYEMPIEPFQDDQWDPEIEIALEQHLRGDSQP